MASARGARRKNRGWPWASHAAPYYRRCKQARERATLADRQAMIVRAEVLAAGPARDLDRCAAIQAVMARELNRLPPAQAL
jgi:hypothetical protein